METEIDPNDFGVTPESFLQWRSPRRGNSNPQKIKSPVWQWLVRSKLSGYGSTKAMSGPSPFQAGPTWSFDRYGQTVTKLEDGRKIYIGGEHEDHYDPDFYIYNDVIVEYPNGEIVFYCYPLSIFPATDFHTATLIDNFILIVGSLGYIENRGDTTQVCKLNLTDFSIEKIDCTGQSPGWLHNHSANLKTNENSLVIQSGLLDQGRKVPLRENIDDWSLNIETWEWRRLTDRQWQRFECFREDKGKNFLYEMRHLSWCKEVNWQDHLQEGIIDLKKKMGVSVDYLLIEQLYQFSFEHSPSLKDEEEFNLFCIVVQGIKVRFVENLFNLQVTVEGQLDEALLQQLKTELSNKLEALLQCKWVIRNY